MTKSIIFDLGIVEAMKKNPALVEDIRNLINAQDEAYKRNDGSDFDITPLVDESCIDDVYLAGTAFVGALPSDYGLGEEPYTLEALLPHEADGLLVTTEDSMGKKAIKADMSVIVIEDSFKPGELFKKVQEFLGKDQQPQLQPSTLAL